MNTSASTTSAGKQPPVGIDLGTTYSLVAFLDATGRPTTVPNGWGDLLTPSAVFCDDDDIVVGKEAIKNAALAPDRYAECFKRDMGGMNYRHKIRDLNVPPEILSAFVLERLKKDAQQRLGSIHQVVVTVPAPAFGRDWINGGQPSAPVCSVATDAIEIFDSLIWNINDTEILRLPLAQASRRD